MAQPLAALDSAPAVAYQAILNYQTIGAFYASQQWDGIGSLSKHH